MIRRRKTIDSGRFIAAQVLDRFDAEQKKRRGKQASSIYASDILNALIESTDQRARATDLVLGTIRNRRSIDLILGSIADTPARRISPRLINIVRVGVYELVYRPETAEYSVINEAAENAKRIATQKQVGFVNAVLRKVDSRINKRTVPISRDNIRCCMPQNTTTGCEFARRLLADPQSKPVDYLSGAYSLPVWLVKRLLEEYGFDDTRDICIASNRRSSIYLRPNTIKTTAYGLAEILSAADIEFDITPDEQMIRLFGAGDVSRLPGFETGLFTVQDFAASKVVVLMEPSNDRRILDLCAAPGTKTTQLAELTDDKAEIFATDIDRQRLQKVKESSERLGLHSISILGYEDVRGLSERQGLFDSVLLDVPCSNTGVLAKRAEVRDRLRPKLLDTIVQTQKRLLEFAAELVKEDGRICYSTCSILDAENRQQIQEFITGRGDFELITERLTLPTAGEFDHDGGYLAILKRVSKA